MAVDIETSKSLKFIATEFWIFEISLFPRTDKIKVKNAIKNYYKKLIF